MPSRRQALARAAALLGALAVAPACQSARPAREGVCPSLAGRRLRWIVPNAAGGGYDTESRMLQPLLARRLGADIVIDNPAGAGGLVGARAIAGARPDGSTLGILSVPGLLVASLIGETQAPESRHGLHGARAHPAKLARLGHRHLVAVLDHPCHRRRLGEPASHFAINEVGSAAFVSITATAALLGIDVEFVGGFSGSRNACLAAMRGDVDFVCFNFESISDLFKAGDLRPLLQVSVNRIANDRELDNVPVLGGAGGFAAAHARTRGQDSTAVVAAADGLAMVMGGGRILVAPAGLPEAIGRCLADAVADVLSSPELTASTSRTLDTAPAEGARADVLLAAQHAPRLLPAVGAALARMRG